MARLAFGRSELELLLVTVVSQLVALLTLLRVATGVATSNPPSNSSSVAIVVPTKINQSVSVPISTPQFSPPTGNGLDASFLLALFFVGANIAVIGFLAFLYRKRKMKLFSLLISLFLVFNVTELYFTFLLGIYSYVPVLASIVALIVAIIAAYFGNEIITNLLGLFLAFELGSSFPILLQAPLNWIIPLVYAIFDIYAVYYGRLGKLVREVTDTSSTSQEPSSPPSMKPPGRLSRWPDFGLLSIRLGDIEIGMADIAFYTMVPAVALVLNSLLAFVVVMVFVDLGLVLSFPLFKKKEVSPGLPIPILLGLGALLVMSFII